MKSGFAQSGQWIVSRYFYEKAFEHFKAIDKNEVYQNFLWYLFFGTWCDEESDNLLLCRETLAAIKGQKPANFVSENFLREIEQNVLGEGNLQWSRWRKKHCKQLLKLKLGEFAEILRGEYEGRWDKLGLMFLNGESWSPTKARHARKTERVLAEQIVPGCNQAEFIHRYLNRLPRNRFTKIINKNYQNAFSFVVQSLKGEKLHREARILRRICLQPQPFYSASPNGNTARLFTKGHIPDLKSDARKILTQGWQDADLRCSQLAIGAARWKIKSVLNLLETGENIWNYLFSFFELPENSRPAAKRIFKKALYSICYGMEKCHLKWCIMDSAGWSNLGFIIATEFLEIPLIRDLLIARSLQLEKVANAKGAEDCYGKWIQVSDENQPRDILAQQAQSWELKLIFPAFDIADKTEDFKIMLFQHDGFTVFFRRYEQAWRNKIKAVIDDNAQKLGIPTSLEWDKETLAGANDVYSKVLKQLLEVY